MTFTLMFIMISKRKSLVRKRNVMVIPNIAFVVYRLFSMSSSMLIPGCTPMATRPALNVYYCNNITQQDGH